METVFTPSRVRLRRHASRSGPLNWLLFPGGPGIGSESLAELADALRVPGDLWLVDLPGDGSNIDGVPAPDDCYARWPQVLLEAAEAVENPVCIGHSTGGMYLLSVPELERRIRGLALVSTAPDAGWKPRFVAMTELHPLPEVERTTAIYIADRTNENLRDIAVASAEWNFTPGSLAAGRDLLARMPYNYAAVEWSDRHFDDTYAHSWWPARLPVLILAGAEDRIVSQHGWDDPRFGGRNVLRASIPGGGHFPWIENPAGVAEAFGRLAARMLEPASAPQ
ncbi:MAG: alpha/beta fold hydrolase [Novosphingobium sp.]|nr:alpha/beta fold hydrolase [Novosphingobium sp.]MBO9602899.1 alpha/beta fold hydrolase [Novosphingobium sp.]